MRDPLRHLLAEATARLQVSHIESPALEAEILLAHVLGTERFALYTGAIALKPEQRKLFSKLVARRVSGIPLQYLTRKVSFGGLQFRVAPGCFIPRPETEELLERCLALLRMLPGSKEVLDIGTGCGAIALSLASWCPSAQVIGTDISARALNQARVNRRLLKLGGRVRFYQADLFPPLRKQFHLIVSNPPYIATSHLSKLSPEVRAEPRVALDGGPDGLRLVRRLLTGAARWLVPKGFVVLEVAGKQARCLAREKFPGLMFLGFHSDFSGGVQFPVYEKDRF